MTLSRPILPATLAIALAFSLCTAHPARAQGHRYTRTRTVITHYTHTAPLTGGQREAQRLHSEAVRLDHQATYEDQHGHPQVGASLARQASQLNAQAFRAARH